MAAPQRRWTAACCVALAAIVCGSGLAAEIGASESRVAAGAAEAIVALDMIAAPGDEVCSLQLDVTFDEDLLTVTNVSKGDTAVAAQKDVQFSQIQPGTIRVIVAGFNQFLLDDGVFACIHFEIAPGCPEAAYAVGLSGLKVSDPFGVAVPSQAASGAIILGEPIASPPEDINRDDTINAVDVQLVINAALGLDVGAVDCDVDADGAVNAVDVQKVINAALGVTLLQ